jgi:membrane associated rhomboid family serine protease
MAFLQEPERQPLLRVPASAAGLIAALVIAHVARVMSPLLTQQAIIENYAFFPMRYSHAYLVAHNVSPQSFWDRAIPFVSYIFLHANFTHLAINCAWLLPFGSIVARRFGVVLFLTLFLVCGVAGAAAHLATHWGTADYAVGASAAIAGLMAVGFRVIAPINAVDVQSYRAAVSGDPAFEQPLAPLLSLRFLGWTAVFVAINVVAGRTGLGAGPGPGPDLIAWQAHIGGYLAGMLLAGPFDALAHRFRP